MGELSPTSEDSLGWSKLELFSTLHPADMPGSITDLAEECANNSFTHSQVIVGMARNLMVYGSGYASFDKKIVRDLYKAEATKFINSGGWDELLSSVSVDRTTSHELQLAILDADPKNKTFHIEPGRRSPTRSFASVKAKRLDSGLAISKFLTRQGHGTILPGSAQALAIAQAHFIGREGMLNLDPTLLEDPNPLLNPCLEQLKRFRADSVKQDGVKERGGINIGRGASTLVNETIAIAESFLADSRDFNEGFTDLAGMHSRPWMLNTVQGLSSQQGYLEKRESTHNHSNRLLGEKIIQSPEELDGFIQETLKRLSKAGGELEIIRASEDFMVAWATISLRQYERPMLPLIEKYHQNAKRILESFVIEGEASVRRDRASLALRQVMLSSSKEPEHYNDIPRKLAVFTDRDRSASADRRDARIAFSEGIKKRFRMAHTYRYDMPHVDITVANCLLRDALRFKLPEELIEVFAKQFAGEVLAVKSGRSTVYSQLPAGVAEQANQVRKFNQERGLKAIFKNFTYRN